MHDAGVRFRWSRGTDIRAADWDFFYRCYARTYREHGNPPYLNRDFFHRMAAAMPEAWLLFIAEREGKPIAIEPDRAVGRARAARTIRPRRGSPTAATGVRSNGSTACTSRPATTSRCSGASSTACGASKAARRASTRWRAR